MKQVHTQDSQMLGSTMRNLFAQATLCCISIY